jgi:predicted acyl esterase
MSSNVDLMRPQMTDHKHTGLTYPATTRRKLLAGGAGLAVGVMFSRGAIAAAAAELVAGPRLLKSIIYGGDPIMVPYRKALPLNAPRARFTGLRPGTILLKKGSIRREGALPLPCDIVMERDVALKMRDGTTIYTDVFRPAAEGQYPALVAWSPYGKDLGGQWLDDVKGRAGVPLEWVSELQKFEGPDPAFWVSKGYVVLNPDPRGAYNSEGNISYWGRQLAEDGYDFIEWGAKQPWSNGKLGMAGNSWLCVSQWFIAAECPPHLAAIAPWEGFTDHFRDTGNRGGIPAPAFPEAIIKTFAGKNLIEDQPRMILEQQLMSPYWADKRARLERIKVPAYVVASYTNAAHTHGSFDGFRRIGSKQKWLRVNNTNEWLDFYTPKYSAELLRFFDRYLKDEQNGWEQTPKVRVCVLDPSGADIVDRVESDWPLPRQKPRKLFLADATQLGNVSPKVASQLSYDVAAQGKVELQYVFERDTEITGYMSLRLWLEAKGANDMELAVSVEKRAFDGKPFLRELGEGMVGPVAASGLLRVSHRALDRAKSTPFEPYLRHDREELLSPGQVVPVDIGIWPMAMRYRAGERLVLTIAASRPIPTDFDMHFGAAPLTVPRDGGTFMPGSPVPMVSYGGQPETSPAYAKAQQVPAPQSRNRGEHIIHFGGKYDSHLLVPEVSGNA